MLLQGSPEYHRDSKTSFMLEAIPDLKALDAVPSPHVLNTHLLYRWLPRNHVENGGKIVHVIRNPKDVCVSMYHFLKGIPYMGTNIDKMTWEQYLNNFVFCDGKVYMKFRFRKKKSIGTFCCCYATVKIMSALFQSPAIIYEPRHAKRVLSVAVT